MGRDVRDITATWPQSAREQPALDGWDQAGVQAREVTVHRDPAGRYVEQVRRALDDSGLASVDGPWDAGAADIVPIRIMMRLSGRMVPWGRDAAGWPR